MDISLITSLYRSTKFLPSYAKNIDHVAMKLLKKKINLEIILVSNQPGEYELEFLKELKTRSYIKVIIVERESLYSSWNRGIRESSSSVVGFWNVDDKRFWRAIEDGVALIREGAELIYFPFLCSGWYKINRIKLLNSVLLYMISHHKAIPFNESLFNSGMHCGPFFIFEKKLIDKIGFFNEQFKIAGDFDWCLRAAAIKAKFAKSKKLGGVFKIHGNNLTNNKNINLQMVENEVIYRTYRIKAKYQNLNDEQDELLTNYHII